MCPKMAQNEVLDHSIKKTLKIIENIRNILCGKPLIDQYQKEQSA